MAEHSAVDRFCADSLLVLKCSWYFWFDRPAACGYPTALNWLPSPAEGTIVRAVEKPISFICACLLNSPLPPLNEHFKERPRYPIQSLGSCHSPDSRFEFNAVRTAHLHRISYCDTRVLQRSNTPRMFPLLFSLLLHLSILSDYLRLLHGFVTSPLRFPSASATPQAAWPHASPAIPQLPLEQVGS